MTTVAFFDLDYTLLNTSSGIIYMKELLRQRRISLWRLGWVGVQYRLKQIDFGEAHLRLISTVGQNGQTATQPFFEEWVACKLLPQLNAVGRRKIDWHTAQGHRVVIISASIEEIVRPVANHLGVDYLCTRLAVKNNRYTGQLDGPLCYGHGKVSHAARWAAQNNLDFPQCVGYFYTDSSSDLPLLDLAQNPVPVNPSRRLAKIAAERGWLSERFY